MHARPQRDDGPVDVEEGTGERDAREVAGGELVRACRRQCRLGPADRIERNALHDPFGGPVAGEREGIDLDDRSLSGLDEPDVPVANIRPDLETAVGRHHRHQPVATLKEAALRQLPHVLHHPVHRRRDAMPDASPPRLNEFFTEPDDPKLHVHELALPRGLVLETEKPPGGLETSDLRLFPAHVDCERLRPALHLDTPGELAQVVVARSVRTGGERRKPVHLLAHDRQQPIDQAALHRDGGESQPPRINLPVRLGDGGREPPAFEIGQTKMHRPSVHVRVHSPGRVQPPAPAHRHLPGPDTGLGREQAQPARGAPGLAELGFDPPDLRSDDRVVKLDQHNSLAHARSLFRVERRDHPRLERLDLPRALPGDDLAAGRGDDVDLRGPRARHRGDEQHGEDEHYAHRARCGGSQRDHIAL